MSDIMPLASLLSFYSSFDTDGLPVLTVTYKDGAFVVRLTSRHICVDVDLCCPPSDENAQFAPNQAHYVEIAHGDAMDWNEIKMHPAVGREPRMLNPNIPIKQPYVGSDSPPKHVVNIPIEPGRIRLTFTDDDVIADTFDVVGKLIPGLRFQMNADGAQVVGGAFTVYDD